jgi:ParB family chromosome partitioning protein
MGSTNAKDPAGTIATKPELVQISTTYGGQKEGSTVLPRNKYTSIQEAKPKDKQQAQRPEYKTCKFTTEAIVTEGSDVGTIHKVCANPSCPVHHPKQQASRNDEKWKAEQDKQRKEQAIANATGLRVLDAIGSAVPVRLLKRDLLFILEKLVSVMDENRVETLARQHGIRQKRDDGGVAKTLAAFLHRVDESTLSRMLVESSILLAASRGNPSNVLKGAASAYKVDTDAITAKVKQKFAAKEKAKKLAQSTPKAAKKSSLTVYPPRDGQPSSLGFCCSENRGGRTRAGFSLRPSSAHSSSRSPAARRESSPRSRKTSECQYLHLDLIGLGISEPV